MTICATVDLIASYFASYEVSTHEAKSGTVYINIGGVSVRVSDHKKKVRARPDFDIRTDLQTICRPRYTARWPRVYLREIKEKVLDRLKK